MKVLLSPSGITLRLIGLGKSIANNILREIPGTSQFRQRVFVLMLGWTRSGLNYLYYLKSIDQEKKTELWPLIRRYYSVLSLQPAKSYSIRKAANIVFYVITLLITNRVIFLVVPMFYESFSPGSGAYEFLARHFFLISVISLPIFIFILNRDREYRTLLPYFSAVADNFDLYLFLALLAIVILLYFLERIKLPFDLATDIFTYIFLVIIFPVALLASSVTSAYLTKIILWNSNRKRENTIPHMMIPDVFVRMLGALEYYPEDWNKPAYKRFLLRRLEEVASLIQHNLPKSLGSGDISTDIWFTDATNEIAAYIRSMKKWILTPMHDTQSQLTRKISEFVILAYSGDWHDFDRASPEKLNRNQVISIAFPVLRTLIVAALPAIIFVIIEQTPLAVEGVMESYVRVGITVWIAVTLLTSIDPYFGRKVETFRDITKLFSGYRGESDQSD